MRWVVTSFTVCLAHKPEDESVKRVFELTQRKLKSVAFIMSYHSRYYSDPHVHVTQ